MGTEAEELKNDRKTRFKYTKEGRQIGTGETNQQSERQESTQTMTHEETTNRIKLELIKPKYQMGL